MLLPALHFPGRRTPYLFSSYKSLTTTSTTSKTSTKIGVEILAEKERRYSDFLKNAQKPHGEAVHAQLIKNSCMYSSTFLQNFLLNMYLKSGDLDSALHLFDEMPQPNVVSWSSLIAGFARHGFPKGLFFLSGMFRASVVPNEFTLVSALKAYSVNGFVSQAYQVYAVAVRLGFEYNVFVLNAFLTALIRNGRLTDAIKAFDQCLDKDIVSWNVMISGYLQLSSSEIPGFWLKMIREGMKPDGFTFSTVFSGLASLGDANMGVQIHGLLAKCGHGSETCVGNSVLDMYLKFGNLANGFKAFHEISNKNVLSWTTIAIGCLSCGAPSKALKLLEEMKMTGVRANQFSLATTFKACADLASLDDGKRAHGLRIKLGNEMDICVDNALLDMYVKCGCMNDAKAAFQRMKDRTIVTWTTMVMGFAQNGKAQEALNIFDEMVNERVEPNYITFVCVLYACCQGGFVDEGWKYFSSMINQYGISPGEDHYVCMVDLLGRTGHITEAEKLVSKMPFQLGPLVWQTLLAACHIHADIEAGKRIAEHAMNLNHSNPSTYVLLSNWFAGSNHWERAKTLRDMMGSRNVNKIPGISSITTMD